MGKATFFKSEGKGNQMLQGTSELLRINYLAAELTDEVFLKHRSCFYIFACTHRFATAIEHGLDWIFITIKLTCFDIEAYGTKLPTQKLLFHFGMEAEELLSFIIIPAYLRIGKNCCWDSYETVKGGVFILPDTTQGLSGSNSSHTLNPKWLV